MYARSFSTTQPFVTSGNSRDSSPLFAISHRCTIKKPEQFSQVDPARIPDTFDAITIFDSVSVPWLARPKHQYIASTEWALLAYVKLVCTLFFKRQAFRHGGRRIDDNRAKNFVFFPWDLDISLAGWPLGGTSIDAHDSQPHPSALRRAQAHRSTTCNRPE